MKTRIVISKGAMRQLQVTATRARNNADVATERKVRGIIGVIQGSKREEIATILGVTTETIRCWFVDYALHGIRHLKLKKAPGRPPNLTKSQKKELKRAIKNGPEAAGYDSGCWRSPMVQDFILKKFGILFAVAYIAALLKNMGLSYQKARFASAHLDPKKRSEWLTTKWPAILALSKQKDAYLLFCDEASFPQWGSLSYTWAPKGKQPTVKTCGKRRGYKVFGLIDFWTGKFFHKGITGKFTSESYAEFLRGVITNTRKHLIIIQDGARYHTSQEMQIFFYDHKDRITIFQMPSYSPDYNPIEILWKKVKHTGIHLKYFPTFESLMSKVDELLTQFAQTADEVLKVFGFYTKPRKA